MKRIIILGILIFIAGFAWAKAGRTADTPRRLSLDPQSLFDTYNEIYFDNKLPKAIVVGEEPSGGHAPDEVLLGNTEHAVGSHWYKIQISPRYNVYKQDEEETVLHEMAHEYVWEQAEARGEAYDGNHGAEWQSCMK